jgi:Holliday junction resolvase RusA-like endonuclease
MIAQTFTARFRLPGLNEYIHAVNINRYKGNALKRETQDAIGWAIKAARLEPVTKYPVTIYFEWHEKTKRRDLDNIASAKKFILDALQECGILEGDGQKQLVGFSDRFVIGDGWDGCVVTVKPYAEVGQDGGM